MKLSELTDYRLKVLLGFGFGLTLLMVYFTLAIVLAVGHITKDESYGLDIVLAALGPLGGLFCGWAFGVGTKTEDK